MAVVERFDCRGPNKNKKKKMGGRLRKEEEVKLYDTSHIYHSFPSILLFCAAICVHFEAKVTRSNSMSTLTRRPTTNNDERRGRLRQR
jgi:hypothetical protein